MLCHQYHSGPSGCASYLCRSPWVTMGHTPPSTQSCCSSIHSPLPYQGSRDLPTSCKLSPICPFTSMPFSCNLCLGFHWVRALRIQYWFKDHIRLAKLAQQCTLWSQWRTVWDRVNCRSTESCICCKPCEYIPIWWLIHMILCSWWSFPPYGLDQNSCSPWLMKTLFMCS